MIPGFGLRYKKSPSRMFKPTTKPWTASELAERLNADILGSPERVAGQVANMEGARPGCLVFAENDQYLDRAMSSQASLILTTAPLVESWKERNQTEVPADKSLLLTPNTRIAYARALELFFPLEPARPGVHSTAVIDPGAKVDPSAEIGAHCYIGAGAVIGAKTKLMDSVSIGEGVQIGANCLFYPHVTVYYGSKLGDSVVVHAGTVIGSDGYGFVFDSGQHRKIPQIGAVIIESHVEIGANVTIDRGAQGPTVIGEGTKIDNLVQIAHNVKIGKGCLLVAQCAIAGSSSLGDFAVIAGQCGIAGHLKIGSQVTLAAQSGVMHNIPDGEKWLGSPAKPDRQTKKEWLALNRLPDAMKKLRDLEKRLVALEEENAKLKKTNLS